MSYQNNKQECICTPKCGSCADDDGYPTKVDDPILEKTGVMCVDVKDALLDVIHHADMIGGAGAVKRKPASEHLFAAPPCGFAEPTRPHKRGGNVYDASISTVPNNELIVVDMRVQGLKCRVELPGEPQQVIYVPTSFHSKTGLSSGGSMSSGMKALVAITAIIVGLVLAAFAFKSVGENKSALEKQADAAAIELAAASNGSNHKEELPPPPKEEAAENGKFTIGDEDESGDTNNGVHSGQLA